MGQGKEVHARTACDAWYFATHFLLVAFVFCFVLNRISLGGNVGRRNRLVVIAHLLAGLRSPKALRSMYCGVGPYEAGGPGLVGTRDSDSGLGVKQEVHTCVQHNHVHIIMWKRRLTQKMLDSFP